MGVHEKEYVLEEPGGPISFLLLYGRTESGVDVIDAVAGQLSVTPVAWGAPMIPALPA